LAGACTAALLAVLWWPNQNRAVSAAEALGNLKRQEAVVIHEFEMTKKGKTELAVNTFVGEQQAYRSDVRDMHLMKDGILMIDWKEKFVVKDDGVFPVNPPALDISKILTTNAKRVDEKVKWQGREAIGYYASKAGTDMEETLYVDPVSRLPIYYEAWTKGHTYGIARTYEYPSSTAGLLAPREHVGMREINLPKMRDEVRQRTVAELPTAIVNGVTYHLLGFFVDADGTSFAAMDSEEPGYDQGSIEVKGWPVFARPLDLGKGVHEDKTPIRIHKNIEGKEFYFQGAWMKKNLFSCVDPNKPVTIRVPVWSKEGARAKRTGYAEFRDVKPMQVWSSTSFLSTLTDEDKK
jgi:hypothetical protein